MIGNNNLSEVSASRLTLPWMSTSEHLKPPSTSLFAPSHLETPRCSTTPATVFSSKAGNFLVTTDFAPEDEADAKYTAYSASRLHDCLETTGARLKIFILDACRNNPFRSTRSATSGSSAMNVGRGTFIANATAPGRTASDNPAAANGLFTIHLISALKQPGLSLDQVFSQVREKVYADSGRKQLPWTGSSVTGQFYSSPARFQGA